MKRATAQDASAVIIAVMGTTGTGKSTFINLLTKDDRIRIGHNPESETLDIQASTYIDRRTSRPVVLIDTPGFDDSRPGVTDTDILEKIVGFLEPANGAAKKLNGIIYMHRISDPRIGGLARKNIGMLQALCGDSNLDHVRIVTTNWSRVNEEQGRERQDSIERGAFKSLVDAGARVRRHTDTIESAEQIISELTSLPAVAMQIQHELQDGKTLADTSAGVILAAELREAKKKHEKELADLRREMEEAAEANDAALRAELEQDRKELELKVARVEEDRSRLERTFQLAHADPAVEQARQDSNAPGMLTRLFESLGAIAGGLLADLMALKRAIFGT